MDTINPIGKKTDNRERAMELALNCLVWILSDLSRAQRLLSLSGLTPDQLRAGANDPSVMAEILAFLEGHEPDLVAAAQASDTTPQRLIEAKRILSR
jgi:hypothetical protein